MSLTKRINALKQKRSEAIGASRTILETAEADGGRDLTESEDAKFSDLHAEDTKLLGQITRLQSQVDLESSVEDFTPATRRAPGTPESHSEDDVFRAFCRGFDGSPAALQAQATEAGYGRQYAGAEDGSSSPFMLGTSRDFRRMRSHYAASERMGLSALEARELRAQSIVTAGKGPELVPEGFVSTLEDRMLDFGGMLQVANVLRTTSGNPLPWPKGDNVTKGVAVAESTDPGAADLAFTQVTLGAHKFSSQRIMIPTELIEDSAIDVVQYAADVAGERLGRIENEKATVGVGTTEPEGITVGATDSTEVGTLDDVLLLNLAHSVDPAYRRLAARYMFNDASLLTLKKLKDSNGAYLWMPSMIGREPDTLHGYPFTVNQDMPSHAGSAASVIFGAMQKFTIRSVRGIRLQVLRERYAELDQVAVVAFHRMDSLVIQPNAIKYAAATV